MSRKRKQVFAAGVRSGKKLTQELGFPIEWAAPIAAIYCGIRGGAVVNTGGVAAAMAAAGIRRVYVCNGADLAFVRGRLGASPARDVVALPFTDQPAGEITTVERGPGPGRLVVERHGGMAEEGDNGISSPSEAAAGSGSRSRAPGVVVVEGDPRRDRSGRDHRAGVRRAIDAFFRRQRSQAGRAPAARRARGRRLR